MALPNLTDDQRRQSLAKAAKARHQRAELKARIKRGEVSVADVLASADPIATRMRVLNLIESVPGYGKEKAAKLMATIGIDSGRRVGGLGARQREGLLRALGDR